MYLFILRLGMTSKGFVAKALNSHGNESMRSTPDTNPAMRGPGGRRRPASG